MDSTQACTAHLFKDDNQRVILKTFEWKVYKKIVFYVELSNPNKDKNRMFFFVVEELEWNVDKNSYVFSKN